jgi:hypothetical protein
MPNAITFPPQPPTDSILHLVNTGVSTLTDISNQTIDTRYILYNYIPDYRVTNSVLGNPTVSPYSSSYVGKENFNWFDASTFFYPAKNAADWISPMPPSIQNKIYGNQYAGTFVYRVYFDLITPSGQSISSDTFTLSGSWAVDNSASIFLNGNDTGIYLNNSQNYTSKNDFIISGNFVSGRNYLDFNIYNPYVGDLIYDITQNPVGLYVEFDKNSILFPQYYAPTITTQSAPILNVGLLSSISMSVNVIGSKPINYQWYLNNSPIFGANQSYYYKQNAYYSDSGSYILSASNSYGIASSTPITVNVGRPVIINNSSSNVYDVFGSDINLFVSAVGDAPISYQWYQNNISIDKATSAVYFKQNSAPQDVGIYNAVISNAYGGVTSNPIKVDLHVAPSKPNISYGGNAPVAINASKNISNIVGSKIDITANFSGNTPFTYQWYFNNVAIPNATSSIYSKLNTTSLDSGQYYLKASNAYGFATSSIINIFLYNFPDIPQNLSATQYQSSSLDVTLEWTPSNLATGYTVYSSLNQNGLYKIVGNTSYSNFVDNTATPDVNNYYFVRAGNIYGQSNYSKQAFILPKSGFVPGWIMWLDMNWLVTVNDDNNINSATNLFNLICRGQKQLNCAKYINNLQNVYVEGNNVFGVYYSGAESDTGCDRNQFCPVLHSALDPLGYTFSPVDITVVNAGNSVNVPFVMHLYGFGQETSIFTSTVIDNLRQIAAKVPVIIFGEWAGWQSYDNYILQNIMNYTSDELSYYQDFPYTIGIPNPNNSFGASLISNEVTYFDYDATGTFNGSLAQQYAFGVTNDDNQYPTMIQVPYR